jgi:hypothetical protein
MTRERAIDVLKIMYQQAVSRIIKEGYEDDWMAAEAIQIAIRVMEEGGDSKND